MSNDIEKRMVQTITCNRCGATYAACCVPECYQSKDWLKEIRQASTAGDTIEMKEVRSFEWNVCKCSKRIKKDKNQQALAL